MGTPLAKLREKLLRDDEVREAYERLGPEFDLARALIAARVEAGLSQQEVAERMGTSQPAVARMEGGAPPSYSTIVRYAQAIGRAVRIEFVKPSAPRRRTTAGSARASKPKNGPAARRASAR